MKHNNYSHELQANLAYKHGGQIKLCNYTVNTANELTFSISNISRKVYTTRLNQETCIEKCKILKRNGEF